MVKRDCKYCAYYKRESEADGLCLFDPPILFNTGPEATLSARPISHPGEFCHRFELSDDVDPALAAADDFGAGERIVTSSGRTGTVIADGEKIGTVRVVIDGEGIEEISATELSPEAPAE